MNPELDALATEYHDFRQRTSPTYAHLQGDYRFAGMAEDVSRATEDRDIATGRDFVRRAEAIPDEGLEDDERTTKAMLAWDGDARASFAESRLAEIDVDPISGWQQMLPVYLPKLGIPNAEVAEAMVDKFRGIAQMIADQGTRHRQGMANGRTPARFAVDATVDQLDAWLADPETMEARLLELDDGARLPDRDAWLDRIRGVIRDEIEPSVAAYRDLLRDEIAPASRSDEQAGLGWLPDGEDTYRRAIRFYTTLDLPAREIHEVGLAQIEKLAGEYRTLGAEVLGTDDLTTIFERLRSDPELHHTDGKEIVAASKTAMAKARAAMGDWFGILPKADCDVEEVQGGAIAYYFPPAKDGSRGGVFFMNTSDPTGWARYEIESTSYHEGIPGHHLQLAIAGELEGIPEFRKRSFIASYGEGWGLYTERLADEMGLYSTPLDRIGMLSADSMRACRLVVDTGMHALKWTRQQAVDYMLANSPMRESHVRAEIDRYVVSAGQALAYMIGRLEIQRIRAEAEQALGDRFDIQGFHDTVLGSGPVPLPLLGQLVRDWVARQEAPAA